jgi:hypothetical protein
MSTRDERRKPFITTIGRIGFLVMLVSLPVLTWGSAAEAAKVSSHQLLLTLPNAAATKIVVGEEVMNAQEQAQLTINPQALMPQGTLSAKAVATLLSGGRLSLLGSGVSYSTAYLEAHGGIGANVAYTADVPGGAIDYDALAIKFPTKADGQSFASQVISTDEAGGGGAVSVVPLANADVNLLQEGVLATPDQIFLELPVSKTGPAAQSTLTQMLFSNGTYYLITSEHGNSFETGQFATAVDALRGCQGHPSNYYSDSLRCP